MFNETQQRRSLGCCRDRRQGISWRRATSLLKAGGLAAPGAEDLTEGITGCLSMRRKNTQRTSPSSQEPEWKQPNVMYWWMDIQKCGPATQWNITRPQTGRKFWHATTQTDPEHLTQRHKWFHLYEVPGIGKSKETEGRLVVSRGKGNGCGFPFCGDENVLGLNAGNAAQPGEVTMCHQILSTWNGWPGEF